MADEKRRKDDFSWVNKHHIFIGFIGTIIAASAYVFTTFATINYVDKQQAQTLKYIDARMQAIDENSKETLQLIRSLSKKIEDQNKDFWIFTDKKKK